MGTIVLLDPNGRPAPLQKADFLRSLEFRDAPVATVFKQSRKVDPDKVVKGMEFMTTPAEMGLNGVVNHAQYVKFVESARYMASHENKQDLPFARTLCTQRAINLDMEFRREIS